MAYTDIETAINHYKEHWWTLEDQKWHEDKTYSKPRVEIQAEYKRGGSSYK